MGSCTLYLCPCPGVPARSTGPVSACRQDRLHFRSCRAVVWWSPVPVERSHVWLLRNERRPKETHANEDITTPRISRPPELALLRFSLVGAQSHQMLSHVEVHTGIQHYRIRHKSRSFSLFLSFSLTDSGVARWCPFVQNVLPLTFSIPRRLVPSQCTHRSCSSCFRRRHTDSSDIPKTVGKEAGGQNVLGQVIRATFSS